MKHFNKIFGTLAVILVFYSLVLGGFDLGKHNYQVAVPNLIVGFFWFVVLGILAHAQKQEARLDAEMEYLEKTGEMLKALTQSEESRHAESLTNRFTECVKEVTGGGRAPTLEEQALIASNFHDKTDHYARFSGEQTGEYGDVEISSVPFEDEVPAGAERHVESPEAFVSNRRVIPVIDGDKPAPKPPTKAQQRRANTKKGLGPLTDDEVREAKNAKRREARAAKKAATTSTTTQPGQTKLV